MDPRQEVDEWIEAGSTFGSAEALGPDGQLTAPYPQLFDESVEAPLLQRLEVLVEHGLGRAGVATPQRGVEVPVQELPPVGVGHHAGRDAVPVASQDREGVATAQHPVVVEAQTTGNQVQEVIDRRSGPLECRSEVARLDVLQRREHRLAREDGVGGPK